MTVLVAALLFGACSIVGATVVTVASLSYARFLEGPDDNPEEDRCPALTEWTRLTEKDKYSVRCELVAGHSGPHRCPEQREKLKGQPYWWT